MNIIGIEAFLSPRDIATIVVDFTAEANSYENLLLHDFNIAIEWHVHWITTSVTDWQLLDIWIIWIADKCDILLDSGLKASSSSHEFDQKLTIFIWKFFNHLIEHIFVLFFPIFVRIKAEFGRRLELFQINDVWCADSSFCNVGS